MRMNSELKHYLLILGFSEEIDEPPKIKDLLKMWRKSARKCHPDKPGGNTEEFQKLQDAFMKAGEMIKEMSREEPNDFDDEELVARRVFEEFNLKKENSNSFTIFIENERSHDWNVVLTAIYGEPFMPSQNESNGRHWKHQDYDVDGISTKISITLWINPKDRKPKLFIKSTNHSWTLLWAANGLPFSS